MPPAQKKNVRSMVLNYLVGIITVILGFYVLYLGKRILIPFLIALFMAYLILPIISAFKRYKLPAPISAVLVMVVVFGILSLFGFAIYQNIQDFIAESGKYGDRFDNMLNTLDGLLLENFNVTYNPIDVLKSILSNINIPSIVSAGVGTFLNFFTGLVLVFFYLSFILLERNAIMGKIEKIAGKNKKSIVEAVTTINDQIQKYIAIKTIVSVVTGLFAYASLKFMGVDFAELWGLLTFLLNFIPNVGSIIASIPPIILAALQFGTFFHPIVVLILLITVQTIMGNVIEPRIMGRQLNLSPLLVFFSLIFWGSIWGITGMILSVPILASISIITWHIPGLKPISILMREKA